VSSTDFVLQGLVYILQWFFSQQNNEHYPKSKLMYKCNYLGI
jgi:hypothetical protein